MCLFTVVCCVVVYRSSREEWVLVVRRDKDVWNSLDQTVLLHQEGHVSLCRGKQWLVLYIHTVHTVNHCVYHVC